MRFLICVYLLLFQIAVYAQKGIIEFNNIKTWPYVSGGILNSTGQYFLYTVNNVPLNENTIVVTSVQKQWERRFLNSSQASFSNSGKWIIFKQGTDTLYLLELGTEHILKIPDVNSYKVCSVVNEDWLVYKVKSTATTVSFNLKTKEKKNIGNVTDILLDGKYLIIQIKEFQIQKRNYYIQYFDLSTGRLDTIWSYFGVGDMEVKASNFAFNEKCGIFAFIIEIDKSGQKCRELWTYELKFKKSEMKVDRLTKGIQNSDGLAVRTPIISDDDKHLFFWLNKQGNLISKKQDASLEIWKTSDSVIQSETRDQMSTYSIINTTCYLATINGKNNNVLQLSCDNENVLIPNSNNSFNHFLIQHCEGDTREANWNPKASSSFYIVSCNDGSRKLLKSKLTNEYLFPGISPTGKWVIFYDEVQKNFLSYEVETGIIRNMTKDIHSNWLNQENDKPALSLTWFSNNQTWLKNDTAVLVFDNYDIWLVDPLAKRTAINLTNRQGEKNKIKFSIACSSRDLQNITLEKKSSILLFAFNEINKQSGFCEYKIDPKVNSTPLLEPFRYSFSGINPLPFKSQNCKSYIVLRMSATEAPNYFITSDFKIYAPLTDIQPQKEFNWLTSELINWKTFDGNWSQGILYKPENFDSTKRYPIIFNFYERMSDELYEYMPPKLTYGSINIPWFVNRGYLVFTPDVRFTIGRPGESAYNSIISAAQYLSKKSWIDSLRMGMQGHSWGAYQVNYLLTCTGKFAAAAEVAGPSDFISDYNLLSHGDLSRMFFYESNQSRIGFSLWDSLNLYIKNSPVLKANKVTTPLLLVHNRNDDKVPWTQGLEWYNALRRNGKHAWWLQYRNGSHGVGGKDAEDYTIKLTEFFDYYLKFGSMPQWMK